MQEKRARSSCFRLSNALHSLAHVKAVLDRIKTTVASALLCVRDWELFRAFFLGLNLQAWLVLLHSQTIVHGDAKNCIDAVVRKGVCVCECIFQKIYEDVCVLVAMEAGSPEHGAYSYYVALALSLLVSGVSEVKILKLPVEAIHERSGAMHREAACMDDAV